MFPTPSGPARSGERFRNKVFRRDTSAQVLPPERLIASKASTIKCRPGHTLRVAHVCTAAFQSTTFPSPHAFRSLVDSVTHITRANRDEQTRNDRERFADTSSSTVPPSDALLRLNNFIRYKNKQKPLTLHGFLYKKKRKKINHHRKKFDAEFAGINEEKN